MKKTLLSIAVLLATTALASAADLPARTVAPAPAPVPVFTWTGFYVGAHGGYIGHDSSGRIVGLGVGAGVVGIDNFGGPGSRSLESDGWIFGGQIGGNVQFGNFVAGVEADLSFTDMGARNTVVTARGVTVVAPPNLVAAGGTTMFRSNMDYFGTLRGRLGVAFDRVMIYGTGGLAFAALDHRVDFTAARVDPGIYLGRSDDRAIGYTVGAGIEYAVTDNVIIKGEYLYYDLGQRTVRANRVDGDFPSDFLDVRFRDDGHIGRVGLNFKF